MTRERGGVSRCSASVLSSAATASGACVALQMAGPLEWQQAEARTQSCCGSCRGYGVVRSGGQAADTAGRAGERREHQQKDKREGELCAARHLYPV